MKNNIEINKPAVKKNCGCGKVNTNNIPRKNKAVIKLPNRPETDKK